MPQNLRVTVSTLTYNNIGYIVTVLRIPPRPARIRGAAVSQFRHVAGRQADVLRIAAHGVV